MKTTAEDQEPTLRKHFTNFYILELLQEKDLKPELEATLKKIADETNEIPENDEYDEFDYYDAIAIGYSICQQFPDEDFDDALLKYMKETIN
jgi:uncharacterized protein YjaG (DUF416 family)